MYVSYGLVKAGEVKYGLGIGADTSQGAPGDALEYTASAGGTAYIATLARETPSAANIRAYADIVRDRAVLRRLIEVGTIGDIRCFLRRNHRHDPLEQVPQRQTTYVQYA